MKKDKRLEKQFDNYRSAIPASYSATSRAKAVMANEEAPVARRSTKKGAVFAFSTVIACVIAIIGVGLYMGGAFGNKASTKPTSPTPAGPTIDNSALSAQYYEIDSLDVVPLNVYATLPDSIKFLNAVAYASNADVNEAIGYKKDGKTVLVKASVVEHNKGNLCEAEIYAEYIDDTYSQLKDFSEGKSETYRNITYKYYESESNGEPVINIYLEHKGVKYYMSLTSSDKTAYKRYLDFILK